MGATPSGILAGTSPTHPTLPEVVEHIGMGFAQLKTSLIGGAVWLADGAEILLIASVADVVGRDWQLSHFQKGSLMTVVFVGIAIGNCISGPLSDCYGRRFPILLSYAAIAIFSILSSYAWNYGSLCALRLLVGTSFGIGQPCLVTLQSETTPMYWRMVVQAIASSLFTVGEMYSSLLIMSQDPYMEALNWRWLLRAGSIPAGVCFVLAFFFLPQSPYWLAAKGDYDEAKAVLDKMRTENFCNDVSVDFQMPKVMSTGPLISRQLEVIFSKQLVNVTVIFFFSVFVLNFDLYGCLYAFPQVFKEDVMKGIPPAGSLFFGACSEWAGWALGALLGLIYPCKTVIKVYLISTTLALLFFALGSPIQNRDLIANIVLYVGYYGIKFFNSVGFMALYTYVSEVYPTEARATGVALCIAGGRIAGMVAPLCFEALMAAQGFFEIFFYILALLAMINLLVLKFIPYDTAEQLKDYLEPLEEEENVKGAQLEAGGNASVGGYVLEKLSPIAPAA
eukprot:gnl/TRDRNA2_/TRDRNA2_179466_c0_seq1.p1 gnl/TRDRNA2_/TRDRNA2_179466_c0~~gnl/TRDRNA2_/TRDRNA2_179466_c0_seq1.p1  ORF type:complete len:507 (-),score=79.04 gnl/TRDRNA2_/TRDRNA2_179466_c0_seq1:146-1666(-)